MAARSRLRALGLVPGAASLRSALAEFRLGGGGLVTSFSDGVLRGLREMTDEDDDEIDIRPLGEVVSQFLRLCDEQPRGQARSGHYVAALAEACQTLDDDSPYGPCARFAGFHRALARTMKELHAWRIGPDELERAAEGAAPASAVKFTALAELEREAGRTLEALGREMNHHHLERSLECRPEGKSKLGRLLVAAGSCDEPLAAGWLRWLAGIGVDVTVLVDLPGPHAGLFQRSGRLATALGASIEPRGETGPLCKALFTERSAEGGPAVTVSSCADILSEAEWTVRGCLEDLDRGLGPDEVGIYARNLEDYACHLESAARRLGLKLRLVRRAPVLTNRFGRLALEALEFCATDDPRLIAPLLKCSYLGLSRAAKAEIRDAARDAYRARKNAWPVFLGWSEAHDSEYPWLRRMLQWREEAAKAHAPLHAWCDRLRSLIDLLPWSADGPTRQRDLHAQTALQRAIAQVASVKRAGDPKPFSLREFAAVCRELWEDEEYTLPVPDSGVRVVSDAECLGELKSLYAVGMLEGVFPRRRSEDPVLNDEDRKALSDALGLDPPLPNSFERAREEREELFRLCAASAGRLTLSYPQTDDSRDNVPAFYLHEVERAAGEVVKVDRPRVPFAPPAESCLARADRMLREALDAPREDALPLLLQTREATDAAAWPQDRPFTPQDLREAVRCEFRHLVSKRLNVRPGNGASRWGALRKLPQAVQLMHQPTPDVARNALEIALEAELDQLYGDLPDWEMALLRSGGRRLIREWVRREFAARELWPKQPETLKLDMPIGAPGLRDKMPGDVPLIGTVAGVSRMGPYVVTHLYEGRPPKQDGRLGGPLDELDTLYYGLYMLSRYTPGSPNAVEVETLSGNRTLLLLPRLAEASLPSRRQDGLDVVDLASGGDGAVATKAFYDEVKRRLARAVSRLRQSGIEPMPGEHCQWCGYGELCRRSSEYGETDSPFGIDDELAPD